MEEFETSNENVDALVKKFAKEKNDIVCGFLKEKEMIAMMHQEEVNDLIEKYEQEKENMRNEFELELKDLLQGFHSQQVEKINEFEREQESLKAKHANEYHLKERKIEMKFKEEKTKMRREFEEIIAEKNEEIKMLRRDLLRVKQQGDSFARSSPDSDIYITRMEYEEELKRARDNFNTEKSELERKSDREKAELVQVFTNQTERMNANFEEEKQNMQKDHQKELQFKLEVTERLLSEKSDLERKRMIQQFEREIAELQESLEVDCKEKLLEKEEAIDDLEKEKQELLSSLQIERFSLAQVYNREISLLTKSDQLTKEDVEVALIDEIAKLQQQHDEALIEMDGQHKQKIEVIKRGQQPVKELEIKHRKEIENLKKQFENEKETFEAEFRKEQFNLLKSFEFERNDLEQRYEEIINEKELEIQQKEDEMRQMYEGELKDLKEIVEEQRKELEVSKQKLGDLAGEMEEFTSEKNRMEDKFYKENNQCQNLEQTIQTNLREFEKSMKEAEALHQKELAEKVKEFAKEKDELKEYHEIEKMKLQREVETLKARLKELQKSPENVIVATSESVPENEFFEDNAGDVERSHTTGGSENTPVRDKSPLGEREAEERPLDEMERQADSIDKTDGEDDETPHRNNQEEVNKRLQKIREGLRKCMPDEDREETLEDLRMSHKQLKEAINQAIVEMDKLCDNKTECDDAVLVRDQTTFSLDDPFFALDDIWKKNEANEESDKSGKDQLKEKIKEIFNNVNRSHEVEKLQLIERHQEEINGLLRELADEKGARAQEAFMTLKRLQELDQSGVKSPSCTTIKVTEHKGTSTDDVDLRNNESSHENTRKDNSEGCSFPSSTDIVEDLNQEKEEMKRSIDELEKHFTKEKEDLMEKLQTQHKEFVMSAEGEIIENLLKQKSTLEEAFKAERFYLGRLYYLEMKDELENVLNFKKEKMKRDFDRDKMEIILKYEKDIADLHSLLSEKGEMELRLLQDKNEAIGRLLATQKRSTPEKGKPEKRRKSPDQLELEKENLEITIPLKREIADLQIKRQQEHETAVANLKDAINLIKEIFSSTPSISQQEEQQLGRYQFISEDPTRSVVPSHLETSDLKTGKRLLVSEDEIRNRGELKAALENLVELVLSDGEDSVYDSETTSGASSDLESDDSGPATINGESDEGAYSGPESTDGDTLNIKKAQLDFAFNLERFNLSRVYYGEYRDSLKKAMRKLAKAKGSLRSKRKDLENDMLSGIKKLVDRTQFGEESTQVSKRNIGTQTSDIDAFAINDHENWTEDDIDGKRLTETKTTGQQENQINMENDQEEKAKRNVEDENKTPVEKPTKFEERVDNSPSNPHRKNDIESVNTSGRGEAEIEAQFEPVSCEDKHDSPSWKEKESGRLADESNGQRIKEQRDITSPLSTEFTANDEPQYRAEKARDPEVDNELSDAPIEKQYARGENMLVAIDSVDTGSGVDAKRGDDESMKMPSRNEETLPQSGKEEDTREDEDDRKEADEEKEAKKEIVAEAEADIAGDYTSFGHRKERPKDPSGETSREMNNSDEDNHEEQATDEDNFKTSGHLDENKGENADENQKEDGGKSQMEDEFEKERNGSEDVEGEILIKAKNDDNKQKMEHGHEFSPAEISNKGVTEGEECKDGNGSDHKAKMSEENPSILKEDTACKTLDEKDEVAAVQEVENGEGDKVNLTIKSPDGNTESREEPETESKSLKSNELNMADQPSHESRREGQFLEMNKEDQNSKKVIDEDKNDIEDDENLSDTSDPQSRTAGINDDDELSLLRSKSPVDDQDLIKQLNLNNKILHDKFNLLCELVGKEFVDEIPELKNEKEKDMELATLESLNDLFAEFEQLTEELKQVDAQMKELTETGRDQLRNLNKRLDDEEMKLLQSLGEIEKQLRRNDDKELTEHLLKEKEDVCTKLDEINNLLNEQKEAMVELGSKDDKTVSGLLCKTDVLKDELNEKAQQLSYKNKMLEAAISASGKEKETLTNSINSLKLQLAALEDDVPKRTYDGHLHGERKSSEELPPEVFSLVKSNADTGNEREKLVREIKKTEREIERCCRMLEERSSRLQPFLRKRARIEKSLDLADLLQGNECDEVSEDEQTKDHIGDTIKIDSDSFLEGSKHRLDEDKGTREKQVEIENKIKELDFAMLKHQLLCELEHECTEETPTAEKLGIVQRFKELAEEDLKYLEGEIFEEQNRLREEGFGDPIQLTKHLEEKEKLSREIAKVDRLAVDGSSSTAKTDPDVKQLATLLTQKKSLEDEIQTLDGKISDEQDNFIDAQQFKRSGKVKGDSDSHIKGLIGFNENLLRELKDTNEKILKSLSTGGLRGPQSEFIEEFVERKIKLEDEIEKLQVKIDVETARAAEALADLLEQKAAISKDLRNITENAAEEAQRLKESISDNDNNNNSKNDEISEFISQALFILDPEATPTLPEERKNLCQTHKTMEELVKENAENLTEAKRKGQDPVEIERALEHVIKEKITVDSELKAMGKDGHDGKGDIINLPSNTRKQDGRPAETRKLEQRIGGDHSTLRSLISDNTLEEKSFKKDALEDDDDEWTETKLPLTADDEIGMEQLDEKLEEKRKELEESLYQIDNRLNIMLQNVDSPNELKKDDLQNIETLTAKKVKLQEDLQQAQLFEDFLKEKEVLLQEQHGVQEANKDGLQRKRQLENEVKKLIEMIDRRESEMQKIETHMNAKEKQLKQLNDGKEELDKKLQPLKETINIATKKVEAALEVMQTNISEQEECSNKEQLALQQELKVLRDEIEQGNKELKEVEEELHRLKKESRQNKDGIPANVIDLEKLLAEKEDLRDYLAEIDATLDKNYEKDASEQESPADIGELRERKKELKLKLNDIQHEKAKLLVEYEDEEMNEVMDGLAQRKRELEVRKEEISDEMCGSGVASKLARKRKKKGYEMPRYYALDILAEMARDEKTLTELVKEQEESKIAAQRQSELLGNMIDLVNSRVGEYLVNSLIALDPEETESEGENQQQAVIDEMQVKGATVSDILIDLSAENKQLRYMNGELSSDLEMLKEKVGEELAGALLSESLPMKESEFEDVVNEIQEEEENLANILRGQREKIDLIGDMLGKHLLSSILRMEGTSTSGHKPDSGLELLAPAIMRKYDEDLENVIAVYEKELDNLSRENSLLKEKLGKDLSRALLQMSKVPETSIATDNREKELSPRIQDGKTAMDGKRLEEKTPTLKVTEGSEHTIQEDTDGDDTDSCIEEKRGNKRERKYKRKIAEGMKGHGAPELEAKRIREPKQQRNSSLSEEPVTDKIDHLEYTELLAEQDEILKQNKISPVLGNIVASHFASAADRDLNDLTDEEDGTVQGSLNAPLLMRTSGNTLGEVIAQYERNLANPGNLTGTREAEMDEELSSRVTGPCKEKADICEVNERMESIVDAQEKNLEMLNVLKERLGKDLVHALINGREQNHLDNLVNDEVTANENDSHPEIAEIAEPQQDDRQKFETTYVTAPENEELFLEKASPADLEDEKGILTQKNLQDEDASSRRILRAPSIALENKKTLADVIASYENGLDSLRSKLGPSLTNTLLSMEAPSNVDREESGEKRRRKAPETELNEGRDERAHGEELNKENDMELTDESPEIFSSEGEKSLEIELKAPEIMATSGKTLEEVIEDYEERINEEIKDVQKQAGILKDKLGKDLYRTLVAHPDNKDDKSRAKEITDQGYSEERDTESVTIQGGVPEHDFKAKFLLQDEEKTVESILRKYEKQIDELSKLVPGDNGEGVSIIELTSNYEDKISDLERENETFANRLANLSKIIGGNLLHKLENIKDEDNQTTEDDDDGGEEDGIKAPLIMQKEDQSLERVVKSYEKELDVLRKLPSAEGEDASITDIVRDYEERIDDLESKSKNVKENHEKLVDIIGKDLVHDMLTLIPDDNNMSHHSDEDLAKQPDMSKIENASQLNAPVIMKRDRDSSLQDVLELYEKALGLLPCPRNDDGLIDAKMCTFDNLKRENKILKKALGDNLVTDLIRIAKEETPATHTTNMQPMSYLEGAQKINAGKPKGQVNDRQNTPDSTETREHSSEDHCENSTPVSSNEDKLDALELVQDEERTIEDILKSYEKELEALRKLLPSETNEGASVKELMKDYEDRIEKLGNDNKNLLNVLDRLKKSIGPGLMNDLQNLKSSYKESPTHHFLDKKPSDLEAPILMENENRTLEGVLRNYESELDVLRKLAPDQGEKGISILDIVNEYEDKLENLKDELRGLREKLGKGLFNDLQLEVRKPETTSDVSETSEEEDDGQMKVKRTLKATDIMYETQQPLEDILAKYEQNLDDLLRENKVFKDGLGKGLAEALLQMAQREDSSPQKEFETKEMEAISKRSEMFEMLSNKPTHRGENQDVTKTMKGTDSKNIRQQSQGKADYDDSKTEPDELRATTLLRDRGENLETILKKYEKELDALRKITAEEAEDGISVSDLIGNYQKELETLEREKKLLTDMLDNLENTIGKDLYAALESFKEARENDDDEDNSGGTEMDINVVNVMKKENRNLEDVVNNYEKELLALRKLVPSEDNEKCSISDIINEYEGKIKGLQKQSEDLKTTLDQLEDNIGSNLFEDLKNKSSQTPKIDERGSKGAIKEPESSEKSEAKYERMLPLEKLLAFYEHDLDGKAKENKALKDSIGQRLAKCLLDIEAEREIQLLFDSQNEDQVNMQDSKEPSSLTSLSKGKASTSEPFDKNEIDKEEVSSFTAPEYLNAASIIRDEGKTVENVLEKYEKELETLSKPLPTKKGISIPDLVTEYEDTIDKLKQENNHLAGRLVSIEQKIGTKLLNKVENTEPEEDPGPEDEGEEKETENKLTAPEIMRNEERTLENVVSKYEQELDALRSLVPSDGVEGRSITDIVKAYEDKVDQLRTENGSLRNDSERLVKRIGPNLVQDIKKLEEISSEVAEGAMQSDVSSAPGSQTQVKDLKVTKIMDVKKSTLEDVLETYESALGIFLSDAPSSRHELSAANFIADFDSPIEELKEENDILKISIGPTLSQRLLDIVRENDGDANKHLSENGGTSEIAEKESDPALDERTLAKTSKYRTHSRDQRDDVRENLLSPEQLKAESLIKEEGRTIENILKNYEKQLEALKSLVPDQPGQPVDNISDLVLKYEDEVDGLKNERSNLTDRLGFLEKTLGKDLMTDVENQKIFNKEDSNDCLENVRKSELQAPRIMAKEDRTLEAVVNCYEKELDSLRKLVSSQENGQQVSISDIIKDYSDEIDRLTDENDTFKFHLNSLTDRLGSSLANDINKLNKEGIERDESSEFESEVAQSEKRLKAPKLMRTNNSTLESVLETYEDALGFNIDNTGLSHAELEEANDAGTQLQHFKDLQEEYKVLISALGDNLAQSILEAAKANDHDDPIQGTDGELVEKRRSPSTNESQDGKPFDIVAQSDDLEAKALIRDDKNTIEDLLKKYEKEIETLSKLIPNEADSGYSISDLVKDYEDKLENAQTDNSMLENKLESLRQSIGQDLAKDLEHQLMVAERNKEDLKAPIIMQKEGKTLENIVRKYEKELEVFRKAESGQVENPSTLTDLVGEYEDKIEELKVQNRSLNDEFDCLKERIGLDLAEDVMLVESTDKVESKASTKKHASNKSPKYKSTKIMQETKTTLASVLESYEKELDTTSGDEITIAENMEILKQKVGSELVNELLLLPTETDSGMKKRWKAVEKMKDEKTTLADILETYEMDLERLNREKSAIEALVNDNECDGQSALDIISQYEDEIEHLKNQKKVMENKISTLISRMGDNLVNDLLSVSPKKKTTLRSSLKALEIMEEEEKQLSAILQQYENEISNFSRENEAFKAIVNKESATVDGDPLTALVSDYERKIQELLDEKQDTEANLRMLSDRVGGVLAKEILSLGETGETLPLDALGIMKNERKTLAEVTKQYENDLERMKRELSAMHSFVSKDLEKSSFVDKISEYEDEITHLKNKITEQTLLEKRLGVELAQQLTTLGEKREENSVFRAIEVMERTDETTLADILGDYEKDLENKDHEILTLKELVSGDILAIATSQESEIDELKNVKKVLANELDLISDKVGKELIDEIINRSSQQPTKESRQFCHNTVEKMENEGKSLADILKEYDKEIKAMCSKNEELAKKEDALTKVSEKIGKDLINEVLTENVPESSQTEIKPLFEASVLMAVEEKTLGEIIHDYEKELGKLKRENGAFRALAEKGGFGDSSPLEFVSEYEEKIEELRNANLECNKRIHKLTLKVGVELTEELLKLPDGVNSVTLEAVNELQVLRILERDETTLAHVLQNYENRLQKERDVDIGPLVFGKAIREDIKLAQIVHVDENEPIITISEEEADETITHPTYLREIPSDDQDRLNTLLSDNETLRAKLGQLSKKVGQELAEELMRPQEDDSADVKAAVNFSSVRDLDAFSDIVTERVTIAQVLESYEKQLKRPMQVEMTDISGPMIESRIVKEDIRRAHLVRANKREGSEEKAASDNVHDGLSERDDSRNAGFGDLDLSELEDLILNEPKIMLTNEDSPPSLEDKEVVNEEIVSVELSRHEEQHSNLEYTEKIFAEEFLMVDEEDQCNVPDSKWSEKYLTETEGPQLSENEKDKLESLKNKVKELVKELEEEKNLKEKYEKDVQDLLQDIVDLKMKQADDDDGETPDETRERIKEDLELKQDNKRLQEELKRERRRRLSIEESKRDLLDELDSSMREKDLLLKQQNDNKDHEKLLEDMINLRKKLGEIDTENKRLKKEVKELKEALSEVVVTHEEEKNKLLAECEKEKSDMMEELVASKHELETQLQELLAMNDDLKGTINSLQEELKESSEKLSTEGDAQGEIGSTDTQKDINDEDNVSLLHKLKLEGEEKERNFLYEKEKNEKLKEQLDETENCFKQTLAKYQDEIKSMETENTKKEDELQKEIEILSNKLHLEKASAEQQRKDFENILQRDRERVKEGITTEHQREKMKLQHDVEDTEEELHRKGKKQSPELHNYEEQWKKEREELQEIFRIEKEKLQQTFDEELKRKLAENDEQHKQRNEEMTLEMNRKLAKEKKEIKATIEKGIYEQLLDKNLAAETDFQEVLSKILQEHSKEIEDVERDIRKAEERFKDDKNKLLEQNESEKEALKKLHEDEKKALESTIQNLLKEVVKLKQQRKEIRIIHKKEKETLEEIYERDRIKLKEDWEQYKRDLLSKLQDDFDNKLANETKKLETKVDDLTQELEKSEQRRKELEGRLKGIAIDGDQTRAHDDDRGSNTDRDDEAHLRELRSVKKSLEEEYDRKLKEEKRKFEETLQGLRREIGNLQEKRRLIQDKIYNQDPSLVDRNVVEKTIASYKMEMLSKMEEEVTQKIAREKKPLEETIREQQLEIDELKRQRWELRNQLRRERSELEEEFEVERERMENQFLKEKEELKNKLDTRLHRGMTKRTTEDKVSRTLSPISNDSPYSPQDSPRRLRSENLALRDDNQRLESDVRQLTSKLENLESSFQGIMYSERMKVEKMKRIQEKMPKKVTFSDEVETRTMAYSTGVPKETVLQELRDKDHQVRQLLEQKRFYEEVLSELCEEAGLFELDQNVVI